MSTEADASVATRHWQIAFIGYGEVGRILAEDLRARDVGVCAYDVKLDDAAFASDLQAHAKRHGVRLAASHETAAQGADLVISAVTASQTLAAARSTCPGLKDGAFFLDFNSASPGAKIEAAGVVNQAGGRYVEGAVMTSVPPHRLRVPLLLGGADASDLEGPLNEMGFVARVASDRLGIASATKMCRSVIVKGLEAMVIESFTAARHYGVEDALIASLDETFPGIEWERQAAYIFQRVIQHGQRRAEEMREAAQTMRESGLDPWIAAGTAERQAWVASLSEAGVFGARADDAFGRSSDWRVEADRILDRTGSGDRP